ncbi:MAG: lipid A biosynthesis acyltransferase [Ferruginibacter sp.]
MYYIIYPILYLFSLLPFFILYRISDLAAFFLRRVVKYRRFIVLGNLAIAFPEKTEAERKQIAKKFYQYFADTFIESIKLLSLSKKQLIKRSTAEFDLLNEYLAKGCSLNLVGGHQFNWEFINLLCSLEMSTPFVGIYMPVSNKALNKIFINLRKRYGTVLISATEYKNVSHDVFNRQYMFGLAADQNPGDPSNAYWIKFFGRPTPFVTGPEKGAIKNNVAVIYVAFKKVKRGYYHFETSLIAEHSAGTKVGELTMKYRDKLEQTIRQDPANYLWSHRRFKFDWKPEYGEILG